MTVGLNRARMTTSTTGTGTITLGSAAVGFGTFAEAGAVNGATYTYVIEDGNDFEIGTGTYTSAGTTLSRTTVLFSKIGGTAGTSKINLSGSAEVFITAGAADLVALATATTAVIEFVINGGGAVITTGVKGYLEIPFACTITQVTTLADQSGSIVVDIWKDTYANYPPTVADTITASAKPTLSSAIKAQDATLTGWTKTIAAGDILGFNVDSVATVKEVTISLKVTKT